MWSSLHAQYLLMAPVFICDIQMFENLRTALLSRLQVRAARKAEIVRINALHDKLEHL